MALQELSVDEIQFVSGASWDKIDWIAAAATALAAIATGGFGWAAFLAGCAVEAAGLTSNTRQDASYYQEILNDADIADWEHSGYYD